MLIDWLIDRAKCTPYFDLPGYMNRFWLVPPNETVRREVKTRFGFATLVETYTDGTGPVTWRRPFVRVLQLCGIAVRVHEILRSDSGRAPHDHPWSFLTVILKGGYYEYRYDSSGELKTVQWHGPGSVLRRRVGDWHRLVLPKGETATTLFITGRKQQSWGFNVNGAKVPYREYKESSQ